MINDLETRRRLSRLKTEAILLSQQFGGVRFDTGKKSAAVEALIKDGRLYLAEENEIMVMEKF